MKTSYLSSLSQLSSFVQFGCLTRPAAVCVSVSSSVVTLGWKLDASARARN